MLERGYTLGNIAELISAWERGQDIGELLGLEAALVQPWSDEQAEAIVKTFLVVSNPMVCAVNWPVQSDGK